MYISTLEYTAAMLQATRDKRERAGFADVERWSNKKLGTWIGKLEGGKYEKYAYCFSRCNGKMLAVTWRGDVLKWVQAAGGTETEADAIYDAFHSLLKKNKSASRRAKNSGSGPKAKPSSDLAKYRSMGFQHDASLNGKGQDQGQAAQIYGFASKELETLGNATLMDYAARGGPGNKKDQSAEAGRGGSSVPKRSGVAASPSAAEASPESTQPTSPLATKPTPGGPSTTPDTKPKKESLSALKERMRLKKQAAAAAAAAPTETSQIPSGDGNDSEPAG